MTVGEEGRETEREADADRPPARPPLRAATNWVVDSITVLVVLVIAAYDGSGARMSTLERIVDAAMKEPAQLRNTAASALVLVVVEEDLGGCGVGGRVLNAMALPTKVHIKSADVTEHIMIC